MVNKEENMQLKDVIAQRSNKTIFKSGNDCVKVFSNDFKHSDVLNEALNHARAEETGLKVPKIKDVGVIDGDKWGIVTEFVEGKTLAEVIAEDEENIDKYLEQFVDLQLEIHSKKSPLLNKLKDKMTRKIAETDFDATTRYELNMRLDSMPKHNKVCHGDFKPSNIIVAEDGWYIIDWSHATQGNASADVARTYLLFVLNYNEQIANKYLDLFCKKSDTAKQYVQKWLPIVAASQSVKAIEKEREFLEKWVDVVEYE